MCNLLSSEVKVIRIFWTLEGDIESTIKSQSLLPSFPAHMEHFRGPATVSLKAPIVMAVGI
jgi:hypothetical protein